MVTMDTTERLLSPRKVADALGISPDQALELMLSGAIRTVLDRHGVDMVPADAIEEYHQAHAG